MKLPSIFRRTNTKSFDWTTIEIKGLQYDELRLKAAKKLNYNEALRLVADDNNDYDEFAVKVENKSGQLIGFIPMSLSKLVRQMINADDVLAVLATDKFLNDQYPKLNIKLQLPEGWFDINDSKGDLIVDIGGNKSRV